MITNLINFKLLCLKEFFLTIDENIKAAFRPEWLKYNAMGCYSYVIKGKVLSLNSSYVVNGKYNSIILTNAYHYEIPVLKNLLKYNDEK